jgi:hypothetical protein
MPAVDREARHTSGMTSRMLLTYLELESGRAAVDEVLRKCGVADLEDELRDENYWFGFDLKMRMFDAAAEVLGDPYVARHLGERSTDLNVGATLKMAVRAFGSPRAVYKNIVGTSGKFNTAHRFAVEELGATRARLTYTDVTGTGYHHHDCQLNLGLLSVVPVLFGQPPAHVEHEVCAVHGAEQCVYELSWGGSLSGLLGMAPRSRRHCSRSRRWCR